MAGWCAAFRTLERPTLGSVRSFCASGNANVPYIHATSRRVYFTDFTDYTAWYFITLQNVMKGVNLWHSARLLNGGEFLHVSRVPICPVSSFSAPVAPQSSQARLKVASSEATSHKPYP